MDQEYAKKLLKKTTDDYNKIAGIWSIKRWKLPPDIAELTKYINPDDNVLDLGCGNGYLYNSVVEKGGQYIGADTSKNQLKEAKKLNPDAYLVLTDPLILPFHDEEFDKVFCLSTIHHIPTKQLQSAFLKEIHRVTKPEGELFLTAWNLEVKQKGKYRVIDDTNILYPFKDSDGKILAERFIHIFSAEELSDIVSFAGFKVQESKIIKPGYGRFSNLLVTAKR
jgi:ubiquinone/menaquinone biosynthesis C-methylase UbiE